VHGDTEQLPGLLSAGELVAPEQALLRGGSDRQRVRAWRLACRLLALRCEVAPSMNLSVIHLTLVGDVIEPLKRLLEDVLTDSGGQYELTSEPGTGDVVIVLVNWGEEIRVIADARALAGDVPLLAILPFGDAELAQRVLRNGAQGWFALDTPLALFTASLDRLAGLGSPGSAGADQDAA